MFKPDISELVDTDKVNDLIGEIEKSDISASEKEFLKVSAYRHAVIDFDKVADYYASASADVQRLMEKQALVIIDLKNAIANGYTQLQGRLSKMMGNDIDG